MYYKQLQIHIDIYIYLKFPVYYFMLPTLHIDINSTSLQMDFIDVKDFTFEKYYHLYQSICQRIDISQVFDDL